MRCVLKNKIIIEDGFSTHHKTGVGQYTLMLENILIELGYDVIHINKNYLIKIKNRFIRRIFYNIWLNTFFLLEIKNMNTTAIFTNYAIPIFKIPNIKYIPVIHDLCSLNHPEFDTFFNNWYQNANVKNAVRHADKILTVSNTIKQEILSTFDLYSNDIDVINSSITTGLDKVKITEDETQVLNNLNVDSTQYILSVATNNKRKNIDLLIQAFNELEKKYKNLKLVLVGSGYKGKFLSKNIIITGYISDEYLKILYKHALLYVFPSLYEGFGTPILDAQYFGVPVLCSDIAVFHEVAGDGAEFCSTDYNSIASKIEYLLNNRQRLNELIELGELNLNRFQRNKIIQQVKKYSVV